MPKVGKMKFPYTKRGMEDARAYSSNTGKPLEVKKYQGGGRVSPSMGPRGPRGPARGPMRPPMRGPRQSVRPGGPRAPMRPPMGGGQMRPQGPIGQKRPLLSGASQSLGDSQSRMAQAMKGLQTVLSQYKRGGKVKGKKKY